MARQRTSVRVNQFAGGFNTEANLLSFPEGASFDEENMDLLSDGSRKRRDGFDTDLGSPLGTGRPYPSGEGLGKNQFVWKNAGGIPDAQFLVVQIGRYVGIHSLESAVISNNRVFNFTVGGVPDSQSFDFTNVDGTLVIATGGRDVWTVQFDGANFSTDSGRLLIRDFFGVEAPGLTEAENTQRRPGTLGDNHLYNLRNQTFALPRPNGDEGTNWGQDPLRALFLRSGEWPSNGDNVNFFLIADSNFVSNRTVERFNPGSMADTPPYNTRAPSGYFIIDAMDRGNSREQKFSELTNRHDPLQWRPSVNLPPDRTPGGPGVISQYAGRTWYAGFNGDVINGDIKSPRMSSYVLFSQVVKEPSQLFWCYQHADPTSHIDPDLVDTDGGYIKIDGAYGINALVPAESSLFVFAENGVWRIVGIDENTFSATSFTVNRLTDKGCVAGGSVVYVDGLLIYWSESAIFAITRDSVGIWTVQDITDASIKSFYQPIPSFEKETVSSYYDDVSGTIRWLYGGDLEVRSEVRELVLNRKYQVFTKNRVNLGGFNFGPITVSGGRLGDDAEVPVTVDGELVTVDGEVVTTPVNYNLLSASQNFYCIITQLFPNMRYVFGGYSNELSPTDWQSLGGIDTPAFITTGFVTGGEGRLRKDIPYITSYFEKTEDVESSCIFQTRWDWVTQGGEWTSPRQIYRPIVSREWDTTVITKTKVRGQGKSVAMNFSSEPEKTFHIYGWEHNLDATTDE